MKNALSKQVPKPLIVAGIMSGTSADGADVALCRISPARHPRGTPKLRVLGHRSFSYPAKLRAVVLAAMDSKSISAAELTRLSWRLGAFYAECAADTAQHFNIRPQLVACHGQTIYHQGAVQPYLGAPVRCTSQIGEPSLLAERLRIPVVSDFRPADMAAGGQGAPLVPMLDFCIFRHSTKNRLLLNLGGIANFTAIPAASSLDGLLAFDTGPANMVIDACMQQLFGKRFDRSGAVAKRGKVLQPVLDDLTRLPYFSVLPPKSCGREEFGESFVTTFMKSCKKLGTGDADIIATATAFTSATVLKAYRNFAWPLFGQCAPLAQATEVLVAGGGARNVTLMRMLSDGFSELGVKVATTEAAGLATEAKEAAAFALLGWLTWHGLPGNVPAATGASRPVVLGKVTHV